MHKHFNFSYLSQPATGPFWHHNDFNTVLSCWDNFARNAFSKFPAPPIAPTREIIAVRDDDLPIYTVLVAFYKEANQVELLTQSLWQLDWPKHKLDIKLICEADDHETIAAITNAKLPSCFDLILVSYAHPRTKPKALNFALYQRPID